MPNTSLFDVSPEILVHAGNTLGEGPVWDEKNDVLHWVDILQKQIHSLQLESMDHSSYATSGMAGCVGLTNKGNLIAGIEHSVQIIDPGSGDLRTIAEVEKELSRNRFNDGKCSPDGGFIVGSMDMDEASPAGALYHLSKNSGIRILLSQRTISNGIAWSQDMKTIYTIDTPTMRVLAHDHDISTGELSNERIVITIPAGIGFPDGMTSDTKGNLWIAMWGGAAITVWEPNRGVLLGMIPLPCLNPTCPTFGGKDLDTLFVTSARVGMTEEQLSQYPHSGNVFSLKIPGYTGSPTFRYKE